MKSRNNVKTVDLYTLDNGTYHSGLRTFDLPEMIYQNTGGGNFLYIKYHNSRSFSNEKPRLFF